MALAYRNPTHPRCILIRLEKPLAAAEHLSMFLAIISPLGAATTYKLEVASISDTLIVLENKHSHLEGTLLGAAEQEFVALVVTATDSPTLADLKCSDIIHSEIMSFHHSFFFHFFDFTRDTDIYGAPGKYAKAGGLAVFTHVYNDDTMLKVWETYYSRIVPAKNLYVIDHGSTSSPKDVLSSEVNVVPIPRGPVDHRAIAQFCNTFQRFLLSQYRWVMHVDADELLVHARGWDYVKDNILNRENGIILKAAHGVDLIHDIASEPALDLSAPISLQRHHFVVHPDYAKPVLSSVPTTWREGFHTVFESHSVVEDEELWLIHLSWVDLDLYVKKSRKWADFDVADAERQTNPGLYSSPAAAGGEPARQFFTHMMETYPIVAVPEWMRGLF